MPSNVLTIDGGSSSTRTGDLDPGLLYYLARQASLAGAAEAVAPFCYQAKKWIIRTDEELMITRSVIRLLSLGPMRERKP